MNFIRRIGSGDKEPEVIGTYLVLTVILHLSGIVNSPSVAIRGYEWIPLLLIGLAAILIRRRVLLTATVIMFLAGIGLLIVGSLGGYFLIFECVFGLFLLGSARLRTFGLVLLCLGSLALGIATWLNTQNAQDVVLSLFMAGFILFTPMLWAENVRTAKELAKTEAQRTQAVQLAAVAREDQLVAEHDFSRVQERTALAREMHDVLSARFSSIALLSGALLPSAPDSVREPLQCIRDESVSGLEDMVAMVRMLHEGGPALQARIEDLPELVANFGSQVRWEYQVAEPQDFSPAVHTAAHRTVSELLVNHAKHAAETALELSVTQDGDLTITARNPVVAAASTATGARIGLENIRTRAQALNGSFKVHSGTDFEVTIRFPAVSEKA
ncbi:histidine kinase [Glutamicibacter ectropisis]|uniref:histidine kinase n=1 Tax=Glutamicibacter ectropisis TaxID=3046593 RepID=A0AAU6WFZ7_9MICC